MDYEKKYKEALERARYYQKENGSAVISAIFPELKESEDEKIRKELIEYIKDQQSSFISAPDCRDKYEEEENRKYNTWISWLEKQGEKGTNGNDREIPNPDWSEEDEKIYNRIYDLIHSAAFENYDVDEDGKELGEYAKITNWFKYLKQRVQPQLKHEWSDEDYNEIETIACHLDNIGNEGMAEVLRNIRDKYYHIIPQTAWKPSEEQMEAVRLAAEIGTANNSWAMKILKGMHQDLKKLKG